jgi:hypothetical protein
MANSRWNMSMQERGGCGSESSLKTSGEEIWYGVFEIHTSKRGSSVLYTLGQLGGHSGIHFDRGDGFGGFQDQDCQVPGSGADFEDVVGLLERGFGHNGACDTGVLENMLAEVLVHLEDGVRG